MYIYIYKEYKDKRKLEALTNFQSLVVKSSKIDNEKSSEVSYRVGCRIALVGEMYTFWETLIKRCAVEMATCAHGVQSKKKLGTVQLSSNTVKEA
jgi:hypothetical protein